MTLHTYLPQDRLRALEQKATLPDRTTGAALFADISGFTPLTDALVQELGARRGLEELTRQINKVYDALIGVIEHFGGSVINFAGDAIMCWFDDQPSAATDTQMKVVNHPSSAHCAVYAAMAMQAAMQAFPKLGLKVAVATGTARRFIVGNPDTQLLDTLAGAAVERTARGEHLAESGEVLVDEATANILGSALIIKEWRTDKDGSEGFGVTELISISGSQGIPETNLADSKLEGSLLRPYLIPVVYERETSGQGSFLTEFRPCATVFVRFTGIDYDADDAHSKLDTLVCQMQKIVVRYNGTLLKLTIGDKGSYASINFGALIVHEDDARRAVKTALELRERSELQLQIGITQGVLRAGTYGGRTRRTYDTFGDDVNLSARLMQTAIPGEILVSGALQKAVAQSFDFEPRPPLMLKGKTEPLPVFAVTGERRLRAIRLQEPTYALPMVGRRKELQSLDEKLDLVLQGQSQVIGIVAEAGMGKSRLIAEVIRHARKKGFAGYGGACQSDAINTPYQVWKSIWSAFFGVDPEMPLRKQTRLLEGEIEDRAPERVEALPLLGQLLGLNIPDNEFSQMLEPELRQSALHALLEDCLKSAANDEPLIIVIEDLHWIDALSHDLLDGLVKALADHPVCFVLAYRPPQLERLVKLKFEGLPQFTRINLDELNFTEAEQAIRAKLAQLYPARSGAVPQTLVEKLMARAQGNPFYLEELLNYLRDRGLDPRDPDDLNKIELPDSLHTLILSRIDQLTEHEKTTLRVACIVGRLFRVDWLIGYYPELGTLAQVKTDLDELNTLDITPLDAPEPELAYLFKHIVTHEVTYESLPFTMRANLHEQLAGYLERNYSNDPPVELLSFHYGHSNNIEKQREYLIKAGEMAQKSFANDAALAYYGQVLPLLKDVNQKLEIHIKHGEVLQLTGHFSEAKSDFLAALELAQKTHNDKAIAQAQLTLGKLYRNHSDYNEALEWLEQAKMMFTALQDPVKLGQTLAEIGLVFVRKGDYARAREPLDQGLELARETGDKAGGALALNHLANIAYSQGDYTLTQALFEESLSFYREAGDKRGIAMLISNLGNVKFSQGNYNDAQKLYEQGLILYREIGDKWGISISFANLGLISMAQKDYSSARKLLEESLTLRRELGNRSGLSESLINLGLVAYAQYDYVTARSMFQESLALCREVNDMSNMAFSLIGLGMVGLGVMSGTPEEIAEARQYLAESLRLRQEMEQLLPLASSLIALAGLTLRTGDAPDAARLLGSVDTILRSINGTMEPEMETLHAQTLNSVRELMGEEQFKSAWIEGQNLSVEESVILALGI